MVLGLSKSQWGNIGFAVPVHVLLYSVLLYGLYVLVIAPLGSNVLREQTDDITNKMAKVIARDQTVKTHVLPAICPHLLSQATYSSTRTDRAKEQNNTWIKRFWLSVIATMACTTISVYLGLSMFDMHPSLSVVGLELLVTFVVIGIVEYSFFMQIAREYVPVMPSFMETYGLQRAADLLNPDHKA